MKQLLRTIYFWTRHNIWGGKGLSQYRFLRNVNYRFERYLRGKPQEFVVKRGLKFFLDPRQSLANLEGDYEPLSTRVMEENLAPGDTFVDVGANLGWFSLVASQKVDLRGKVYAFEPQPIMFGMLRKNIEENGITNIVAENAIVGEASDPDAKMYTVGDIFAGSTAFDPRRDRQTFIDAHFMDSEDKEVREYSVPQISLDDRLKGEKVAFVKIDAEGSEGFIFRGMKKLIEANPQMKILMEFNLVALRAAGTEPEKLVTEIREAGFGIWTLTETEDEPRLLPPGEIPKHGINFFLKRPDLPAE